MNFCNAFRCSSSFFCRAARSARLTRSCASHLAMPTFRCKVWKPSNVTGSSEAMTLASTSAGSSKECTAFAKARTSSFESLPSLSTSCFSKAALRSCSMQRAAFFREAFSRAPEAFSSSLSNARRPCSSLSLKLFHSITLPRLARLSVSSLWFSPNHFNVWSNSVRDAPATFCAASAASMMASGVASFSSPNPVALSSASVTFASASLTFSPAACINFSTFSLCSFLLFSSSSRLRSSSARFWLISSIRRCACLSVVSASSETLWACEPISSRPFFKASSSSARKPS
mmetsp:Transcript_73676/g.225371  ORF Transcript_73676/g.225371 Transcript_73676/m.225371 type:complete len:287 (+) Transcript_73676:951-1811(+)